VVLSVVVCILHFSFLLRCRFHLLVTSIYKDSKCVAVLLEFVLLLRGLFLLPARRIGIFPLLSTEARSREVACGVLIPQLALAVSRDLESCETFALL